MQGEHDKWSVRLYLRRKLSTHDGNLTSFAQKIHVSTPFLSQILSGRRGLSEKKAESIARHLGLDEQETRRFLTLVHYGNVKSNVLRERLRLELEASESRSRNKIRVGEQRASAGTLRWYYPVILELAETVVLKFDPNLISRKLLISSIEAERALRHLVRHKYLSYENGRLRKARQIDQSIGVAPNAREQIQRRMLEKARKALDTQSPSKIDMQGVTFAICESQLPEFKAMISRFIASMTEVPPEESCDAIYHLSVQFFRMDREL